jgi:hypothetical protein
MGHRGKRFEWQKGVEPGAKDVYPESAKRAIETSQIVSAI